MSKLSDTVAQVEADAAARFDALDLRTAVLDQNDATLKAAVEALGAEMEDLWTAIKALQNAPVPIPPDPVPVPVPEPPAKPLLGAAIWPNAAGMAKVMRDDWGMMLPRVCYHPTRLTGVGTEADVFARIQEALDLGMTPIADWHQIGGSTSMLASEGALIDGFMGRVIDKFPGNTKIMLEVWNEFLGLPPTVTANGKTSYEKTFGDSYVNFMRVRIAFIRARGFKGKVIISALDWANDLMRNSAWKVIETQPIEEVSSILVFGPRIQAGYDNIVFSVHPYDSWSTTGFKFEQFAEKARQMGIEFMVSETGMWNENRSCTAGQQKVFAALDAGYTFPVIGWHSNAQDKNDFTSPDTGMTLKKDASGNPTNLSDPQGKLFYARGRQLTGS